MANEHIAADISVGDLSSCTPPTGDANVKEKAYHALEASKDTDLDSDLPLFSTDLVPEGITPQEWKASVRKQRKKIIKEEAKIRRKEKDKIKKEKKKLEKKAAVGRKRHAEDQPSGTTRAKIKKMSDPGASDLTVVIDLNYEDLMNDKDMMKVMQQCKRCYAENRRADAPLQLYITSFGARTMTVWDKQFSDYRNWDIHRKSESYIELFGKERIVFLTSDSPNVLDDLDSSKVYVIGGLVDHNHHKGYCYDTAQELDVAHAQLPISQYVKLNCRTVLAINHVFEILLDYSANKDWEKAFNKAIPPRKIAVVPPDPSKNDIIQEGKDIQEGKEITVAAANSSGEECLQTEHDKNAIINSDSGSSENEQTRDKVRIIAM